MSWVGHNGNYSGILTLGKASQQGRYLGILTVKTPSGTVKETMSVETVQTGISYEFRGTNPIRISGTGPYYADNFSCYLEGRRLDCHSSDLQGEQAIAKFVRN